MDTLMLCSSILFLNLLMGLFCFFDQLLGLIAGDAFIRLLHVFDELFHVLVHHHFSREAQYAALIFPFLMFFAWRALNDSRRLRLASDSPLRFGLPLTPC